MKQYLQKKAQNLLTKRRITMRTGLIAVLTVALVASAAVFIGVSAAEETVTPSDVPNKAHATRVVSVTDVTPSDATAPDGVFAIMGHLIVPNTFNAPENLGDPVITMTTGKAFGDSLNLGIGGSNIYVDYGDGTPVEYPGDRIVRGSNIKVYGDNITELDCSINQLTQLDVSKNTALTWLNCIENRLTELDVSKNTALTSLYCSVNQLTALDVSKNTELTSLDCCGNSLTTLDVSNNSELTILYCSVNPLTALDVSKNTALTDLSCYDNSLTTLDVSKNTALTHLDCSNNQLTGLDMSNNTALNQLECDHNLLSSLNIRNNIVLEHLSCFDNQLTEINVSNNTNLKTLYFWSNPLTEIDLSMNSALIRLDCGVSPIKSLDVTNNTALEYLECSNCPLTSLDLTKNSALIELRCQVTPINELDISKNQKLEILYCESNQLTELDISKNPALKQLYCEDNQMTFAAINSIDASKLEVFDYAPQFHRIPSTVKSGEAIDLSTEYSVDGVITDFIWCEDYDNDKVVIPTTSANGVFTFGDEFIGKKLVCRMTNAMLPDFELTDNSETRLTTTEVTIEAVPTTTTTTTATTSATSAPTTTSSAVNDQDHTIYYDLEVVDNDDLDENYVDDIDKAEYSEFLNANVDGKVVSLHSIKGIHLTVGNIEKNKKKSVLEAIAHYNETINADTNDIALYDIDLTDGKHQHIKLVNGIIAIRIKYPDNLARQSEKYDFHLYHQKDDGTIEEIPLHIKPNGLWFYASDFSPYVLYWQVKAESSPGTGESAVNIWITSVLAILSFAAAGAILYRKRKIAE